MSISFAATAPAEEAELREFLAGVIGMTKVPPSPVMSWKYFEPHPCWPEGRSYRFRTPEGIAAHGCVSQVRFASGGNSVPSMQIVDWASGRLVPGGGLLIYRRCLEAGKGTLLAIGGSEDTRKIIPQLKWFTRKDDLQRYARPVRPWRHFALSAQGFRDLGRFARNLLWQWLPPLPDAGRWRCRPARPGEDVFTHSGDFIPIDRSRAWFDYLLRCPGAEMDLLILERSGTPLGHALLAYAKGCMRVVDFVTSETSQSGRVAAFSALARHIGAQPRVAEIVAASSLPELHSVFESCGLHRRATLAVYLADPKKLLPPDAHLEICWLIGDGFYLYDPGYYFDC